MCTPTFDCSEESLAVRKRRRRSRENCSASLRRSRVSRKSPSQGRVFIVKRGRIHASVPRPGWRSSCVSVAETHELRHPGDRKSTRLNSSHVAISYAVFCLKKKKQNT